MPHTQQHKLHRIGWLRASVMGANDGIVSTASLIVGIAAAQTSHSEIVLAGLAGLVAGAMSMAAGEYVSVCSQADTEDADIELERLHLEHNHEHECDELTNIYIDRGLDENLARQVAEQLMEKDPLEAHTRDELGISDNVRAKPVMAALSSATTFTIGAALPLLVARFCPYDKIIPSVSLASLLMLAIMGAVAARAGGASMLKGAARVTFWGTAAMVLTAVVGRIFGVAV